MLDKVPMTSTYTTLPSGGNFSVALLQSPRQQRAFLSDGRVEFCPHLKYLHLVHLLRACASCNKVNLPMIFLLLLAMLGVIYIPGGPRPFFSIFGGDFFVEQGENFVVAPIWLGSRKKRGHIDFETIPALNSF